MLNTTLTLITMYYIERRYMMQGEFDNDWKDLSILDSKLIDKDFDSISEEDIRIIKKFESIVNTEDKQEE